MGWTCTWPSAMRVWRLLVSLHHLDSEDTHRNAHRRLIGALAGFARCRRGEGSCRRSDGRVFDHWESVGATRAQAGSLGPGEPWRAE